MSRVRTVLFFGSIVAVACGGQILGADGGISNPDGSTNPPPTTSTSTPDAAPPPPPFDGGQPPPPQQCTPMAGGVGIDPNGGCTVTEDWSCGSTKYSVNCTCPTKQCTCSQYTSNGGSGTVIPYYNGCPSCTYSGAQLAQLCGFPSQ